VRRGLIRQRLRNVLHAHDKDGSQFPSAWDDWHRRRLVAERCFVPWVQRVMPLRGRTVLEYGCGSGPVTAAFSPLATRYIGIDIDEAAVGDARRILGEGGVCPELHVAPPDEILNATAAFRGEVDVFLCYAVLEHMTVNERLALLRLAREVVQADGIIVVIETPNRLTPWDYHTSQMPFLNQLPEELALAYLERSPRAEFVQAMQAAAASGPAAEREAFVRWGRGMSFHELELVFDDLPRHVAASSWEPMLLPEREVYRAELALQRVMDAARPDLPAAFSRYWLDFILTAAAAAEPRRFLRPWALNTSGSRGASFEATEVVRLESSDAVLAIDLPSPSARLVVGTEGAAADLRVRVRQGPSGQERHTALGATGPIASYADFMFDMPSTSYEVCLSGPGIVSLVLYEA
jgi:SAM-dependent methyltransferase